MLRQLELLLVVVAVGVVSFMPSAFADGGLVDVRCEDTTSPGCDLEARSPGSDGSNGESTGPGTDAGNGSGSGECRDWADAVVPCVDPTFGWLGSDGCYWRIDESYQPPEWVEAPVGEGAWYQVNCLSSGGFPGTGSAIVWRAAGDAPVLQVDPEVLARQARNQLGLPSPVVATSPSGSPLVGLATWLWVDAGLWVPVEASASVPGVSVTATATPVLVSWAMGDGATVICAGPGTPWVPGGDPRAGSPDCGHTYARSSAGEPGEVFAVTATVTWAVAWVGGGDSGTLEDLTTSTSTALAVGESQALNTPMD